MAIEKNCASFLWYALFSHLINFSRTHLEILEGELQHVPEDVAEDLRLALHKHIFVVERLDHLRLYLEEDNG